MLIIVLPPCACPECYMSARRRRPTAGIREASDTSLLMYDTDFLPKFAPGLLLRTELLYRQGTRKRPRHKRIGTLPDVASLQRLQTTLMLQAIMLPNTYLFTNFPPQKNLVKMHLEFFFRLKYV